MSILTAIEELKDLSLDLSLFEQNILTLANKVGLTWTDLHCDHISVRCNQNITAERWYNGFLKCARLLSNKQINGRPICLFELNKPLTLAGLTIDCVELPYPGSKFYRHEGWEHIELVLSCPPEELHARALERLSDRGLLFKEIELKMSNSQVEGERLANPTLAVSDGLVTIKFHPYSIKEIIASEIK